MKENYFGCILNDGHLDAFKSEKNKLYLVSGSSRGGTSLVAYVLRRSGIAFGDADPNNHEPPEMIRDPSNTEVMDDVIQRITSENTVSAVKFPDFSFHMERVSKLYENTIILYIVRNPISIAKTIVNRVDQYPKNKDGISFGLKHASRYYTAFADALPAIACPVVILDFDRVKSDPLGFVVFLSEIGMEISSSEMKDVAKQIAAPGYKSI